MTDPDDISSWAEGLTPDGSPGQMAEAMRQWFGDKGYEKIVAHNEAIAEGALARQRLVNGLLSVVILFIAVFGIIGTIVSCVAAARFIF